jgi:hypothetical protein
MIENIVHLQLPSRIFSIYSARGFSHNDQYTNSDHASKMIHES